jgi:hypothetical protein
MYPLSKKDITRPIDSVTIGLQFLEIAVIYPPKKNPPGIQSISQNTGVWPVASSRIPGPEQTLISVFEVMEVFLMACNLITTGYWSWWEKMCNKLPYDYEPAAKKGL